MRARKAEGADLAEEYYKTEVMEITGEVRPLSHQPLSVEDVI